MAFRDSIRFASIAARTAARMLTDRENGKRFLIDALTTGGPGLAPKFAQFLAARLDTAVGSKVPLVRPEPVPIEVIKGIIEVESQRLANEITSIDPNGITASLGQVHHARLKDGREVALKIQRPGAREAVDSELKLLLKSVAWSPVAKRAFDFSVWENWLRERLNGELDYLEEAQQQSTFFKHFAASPSIVIPEPDMTLTTSKILVQSWEDSSPVDELGSNSAEFQQKFIETLVSFVVQSIFDVGVVQTDLQRHNFGWRSTLQGSTAAPKLVLYDFGASMAISQTERHAIASLLRDALQEKHSNGFQQFCEMGFRRELLAPIQEKFSNLCRNILAPLVDPKGFSPADWKLSEMIERDLGDDKWVFRTAGPPWFMYLMRMLFGLFNVGSALDQRLMLRGPLTLGVNSYVDRTPVSPKNVTNSQVEGSRANFLQIEVMENGEQLLSIQLPAHSVGDIENLISDETRTKMEAAGTDLVEIKHRAIQSGLAPQTLLHTTIGSRSYRVWLRK